MAYMAEINLYDAHNKDNDSSNFFTPSPFQCVGGESHAQGVFLCMKNIIKAQN